MKSLFILIFSFFIFQSAYSASFSSVDVLGDQRLSKMVEIHAGLVHLHGHCGNAGKLQITARRLNEVWINTAKQAVFFTNTGINAPVRSMKAKELDLRLRKNLGEKVTKNVDLFMLSAFTENAFAEGELSGSDSLQIKEFRDLLISLRGDYRFFIGTNQNEFESASFVVITDLINAEVVVLQAGFCL